MAPKGKKVLMVIAPENFRDEEYREPRRILEGKGCAITVASTHTRPAKGMLGMTVTPDVTLDQVRATDFDLVVFVGGYGAEAYYNDPKAHRIASDAAQAGRPLAAICVAPTILANAGLLKGKKATVWESQAKALVSGGATYTKAQVQRDGSIITADGPTSAVQFGEELARALGV
jgi:protease I